MKTVSCTKATGDGDIDCEAEILEEFRALIEHALKIGWAEEEIANALVGLSRNYALGLLEDAVIGMPDSSVLH
jgi:hypothetical protein